MAYYPVQCPYCGSKFEPQEWEIRRTIFGRLYIRCHYCDKKIRVNNIEE